MPNPTIYENELTKFNGKYNLKNFDLSTLEKLDEKFRYVDEFLSIDGGGKTQGVQFVNWAAKALSIYLSANTKPNEKGEYVSSLNLKEFLADFDNLVDAKCRSELDENQEFHRKKFANAKLKDFQKNLAPHLQIFNKSLPTMWKEGLKKETIDLAQLRSITNNTYNDINVLMEENELNKSLTNMVAAHEAMTQLREGRNWLFGFLWKWFNSDRNSQEEEYLQELNTQINELKGRGLKVDDIRRGLTEKTVLGKDVNTKINLEIKTVEKQKEKEEKKENKKEKESSKPKKSSKKSSSKPQKFEPVADKLNAKIDPGILYRFQKKQLVPTLPKAPFNGDADYGTEIAMDKMNLQQLNQEFDTDVQSGLSEKVAMENYVLKVFKSAISGAQHINYNDSKDTIIAAQRITDAVLKNFSPYTLKQEELQEFVDGYVVKNSEKFFDEIKNSVEPWMQNKLEDGFNNAKAEYADKEAVFGDHNPYIENDTAVKSEPVNQQIKQDVINLNSNK